MDDRQIITLYRTGDPTAVTASEEMYGSRCLQMALKILENDPEAQLCVHNALATAWNEFPISDPPDLGLYLEQLTRRLALEMYRTNHAAKRGQMYLTVPLDELNECIPAGSTGYGSGFDDETETARLGASINRYLKRKRTLVRDIFVCRYYYAESLGEIARRFGLTDQRVETILARTRAGLKRYLEKEGVRL